MRPALRPQASTGRGILPIRVDAIVGPGPDPGAVVMSRSVVAGFPASAPQRLSATVGPMTERTRAWIAGVVAGLVLTTTVLVLLFGRYEPGLRLAVQGDGLVVSEVLPYSPADRDGVRVGMRVVSLNGTQLIRLPDYAYTNPDQAQPEATPVPIPVGPSLPTAVPMSASDLEILASARIDMIELASPGELENWSPESSCCFGFFYPGYSAPMQSTVAVLLGLALLLFGFWLLDTGRGGESLRPMALPAAVAAATPLMVQPMRATEIPDLAVMAGLLTVAAMVPLALALADRIESPRDKQLASVTVAVLTVLGALSAYLIVSVSGDSDELEFLRWASIGAIPLVPGIAAALPLNLDGLRAAGGSSRRLLQSTEFAVVGATPLFALGSDRPPYIWPLAFWLAVIVLAGRFTVRPLARLATRAQLQRDLVVAATEAERARVAADIHDDALQELTLLVRRLETAGDTEGAEMGRTIADRLRAICGDLRLPILDDLGVGPALDWLVLRIERLAGGEVRLERVDGTRPPADVELAIFRVAQEALANAVKHGRPPIVVRYTATDSGASLSIDDAGPGIAADAGATAERGGHFGLLNMQQRAEQIGAILDIRRWPTGGTHVALEWRRR
jgi:signal transduction histidine kinase